jgi:hypothetical protein
MSNQNQNNNKNVATSGLIIDGEELDAVVTKLEFKEVRGKNLEAIKEYNNQILESMNEFYDEYQSKLESGDENDETLATSRLKPILQDITKNINETVIPELDKINDSDKATTDNIIRSLPSESDDNENSLGKIEKAARQVSLNVRVLEEQLQNLEEDNAANIKKNTAYRITNIIICGCVILGFIYLPFSAVIKSRIKKYKNKSGKTPTPPSTSPNPVKTQKTNKNMKSNQKILAKQKLAK